MGYPCHLKRRSHESSTLVKCVNLGSGACLSGGLEFLSHYSCDSILEHAVHKLLERASEIAKATQEQIESAMNATVPRATETYEQRQTLLDMQAEQIAAAAGASTPTIAQTCTYTCAHASM